jgi:type I restriction enzyme M protein
MHYYGMLNFNANGIKKPNQVMRMSRGICASVVLDRMAELDYVLTPGRYVGLADEEDDFNFVERFRLLKAVSNQAIAENLARIKL